MIIKLPVNQIVQKNTEHTYFLQNIFKYFVITNLNIYFILFGSELISAMRHEAKNIWCQDSAWLALPHMPFICSANIWSSKYLLVILNTL